MKSESGKLELDLAFDSFYQAGDEIASIISGLIDATFRAEATSAQAARAAREEGFIYEASDDSSNFQL